MIGTTRRRRDQVLHRSVGGGVVIVVALTLAACGSSSSSSTTTAQKAASTTTAPPVASTSTTNPVAALSTVGPATATGLTVSLAKGVQGIFLIGPKGHTLYIFTKDQGSVSQCVAAACAKVWPALAATGSLTSGPGINSSHVATTHGQVPDQVTYYGHPLYYFEGDTAPGQTKGTSIPEWDLLGPFGNVMLPRS
jgi:predicted lipoprotein with Yx(FWY)xxD motif